MAQDKKLKTKVITQYGLIIVAILFINLIASNFHKRIDLTEDNRFTISEPTKNLLSNLNDVVYIKVYLRGNDLPAGIQRLSDATQEMLDEFRNIAGDKIQYDFVNPDELPDQETRNNLYQQLASKGLIPTELQINSEDKFSQKIIVPGAMLTYGNQETPALLMQPQRGTASPEEELNGSISQLEYQLAFAIKKIVKPQKKKIAILQGHKELAPIYLNDFYTTLKDYYEVDYVNLPDYKIGRLDEYKAIVIAKPDSVFTELEKYKLDQYLVNGGNILFLIDNLVAEIDSLQGAEGFSGNRNLNLEDIMFKYGIRFNYNLVQDLNCHYIPLLKSGFAGQQRGNLVKWPYYPLVTPISDHPIVNSLDAVWLRFAGSIDTISSRLNSGIKKTVLLSSSPATRVMQHPVQINLNMVSTINPNMYNNGVQNFAVLLEGKFVSAFKNRINPQEMEKQGFGKFAEQNKAGKMIVVSDGDVIKNLVSSSYRRPFILGFDPYTRQTFANKSFVQNCVDYMVDDNGLISLRGKQFKLRLLNNAEVKQSKLYWQMVNMATPPLLIFIFGIVFNYIRKRRFA